MNLQALTLVALTALAKDLQLPGRSKLRSRAKLIPALEIHQGTVTPHTCAAIGCEGCPAPEVAPVAEVVRLDRQGRTIPPPGPGRPTTSNQHPIIAAVEGATPYSDDATEWVPMQYLGRLPSSEVPTTTRVLPPRVVTSHNYTAIVGGWSASKTPVSNDMVALNKWIQTYNAGPGKTLEETIQDTGILRSSWSGTPDYKHPINSRPRYTPIPKLGPVTPEGKAPTPYQHDTRPPSTVQVKRGLQMRHNGATCAVTLEECGSVVAKGTPAECIKTLRAMESQNAAMDLACTKAVQQQAGAYAVA